MSPSKRRVFLIQVAASGAALATGRSLAQPARLDEKAPQAVALGYVHDTNRADRKKYPRHSPDQKCLNCSLYQGKDAAWGGCPLFGTQQVAAAGWCSAWARRA